MLYRSDMHRIQVSVTGIRLPAGYVFETMEGGDIQTTNEYYHGGNMAPAVPEGGLRTPTDITVSCAWSDSIYPFYVRMYNAAGFTSATVTVTPLDRTGSVGSGVKPITFSGLLLNVTRPQFQAASSTLGYLSLVIAPSDSVSQN
jgi:hypothetical protein